MTRRLLRRLWRHHLPLGLATAAIVWLFYITRPYPDVITRLSFSTAWPALVLLTVSLGVGPWRVLTRKPAALSVDLRRDIGIWAGITGVAHAGIGQCVHLRGRPWLYYIYEKGREHLLPLRHDMFGFANYTGLFAALILLALLVTSNDASLRKLGLPGWKSLQRWNYACFALTVCHTFGYLLGIEGLQAAAIITASLCVAITAWLQWEGWRSRA
ncbi:MAG: ferric reductase-like transmembrane domain-containing protein [Alphaproteobacteria bacterium]|nr:ferric reductase-like transmembrane domain-containing protein [Alphaproteobacteria bacterium]